MPPARRLTAGLAITGIAALSAAAALSPARPSHRPGLALPARGQPR
jgi:hypothetical protein